MIVASYPFVFLTRHFSAQAEYSVTKYGTVGRVSAALNAAKTG